MLGNVAGTNIRAIERILPDSFDRSYTGAVVQLDAAGRLGVNVQGNVLPARWADPVTVVVGDTVLVSVTVGRTGQSEAIVRARISSVARPASGKVTATPGGGFVTVQGSDGTFYSAVYVTSYTPVIGDNVVLAWIASQPCVVGTAVIPVTSPLYPKPFVAPPPIPSPTGSTTYVATDSDTYQSSKGWSKWNGGNKGVFQGGTDPLTGAWFYSGSMVQLADRTIDAIHFYLGDRLATTGYTAPVTVHFYAHNSSGKPFTNVALVAGPYDVTVQPNQKLTAIDLPAAMFRNALQAGGGIAIFGSPYCGFKSRKDQPDSGKLVLDWSVT